MDKATQALGNISDDLNDYQSFAESFDEEFWYDPDGADHDDDGNVLPGHERFAACSDDDFNVLQRVIALAQVITDPDAGRDPQGLALAEAELSALVS